MKTLALMLALLLVGCSSDSDEFKYEKHKTLPSWEIYDPLFEEPNQGHKRLEELQQEALDIDEDDSILDIINKVTGGF